MQTEVSGESAVKLLEPGEMFGDYTVEELLGKGGMGAVYLVRAPGGERYAVKLMFPEMVKKGSDYRKRFAREAEFAMQIRHKNLISVYDVGEDPETGLCYIIMDYVPGGSVADRLEKNGPLPMAEAVSIAAQVALALEVAHRHGVVHRDIKPDNIMFDADGTPKLADLGVAKFTDGAHKTTVTTTGMIIGTPAYMAPEQMMDSHHVDARADIYALGVVLYEMLTGKRPNEGSTAVELLAKALKGEPLPDVRTMRPEISAAIAHVLSLMCAPKPENRPATALAAAQLLQKAATGRLVLPKKPPRAADAAARKKKRQISNVAIAAAVGLVAFCAVLVASRLNRPAQNVSPVSVRSVMRTNVIERTIVITNTVERVTAVTNTVECVTAVTNTTVNVFAANEPTNVVSRTVSRNSGREQTSGNALRHTIIDGITWTYRVEGGAAVLESSLPRALNSLPCVDPAPKGVLRIPSQLDGFSVAKIGRFAFNECDALTEVHIPEGVSHMDYGAFCQCKGLRRIYLPSTVEGAIAPAFKYCVGISDVVVSDSNPNYAVDEGVIYSRDKAVLVMFPHDGRDSFAFPATVREIAPSAFDGTSLRFLKIPAGVKKIGHAAFFRCDSLEEVVFDASPEEMGTCVFGYSGLQRITFPAGMRAIPSETFRGCSRLRTVVFPDSVESIEGHATFEGCASLENLRLPPRLRVLGRSQLFCGCRSLKRLVVPASVQEMSGDRGTFQGCLQLKEVVFEGNAPTLTGFAEKGLLFEGAPADVQVIVRASSTGWADGSGQRLPKAWPADAGDAARPIRYEKAPVEAAQPSAQTGDADGSEPAMAVRSVVLFPCADTKDMKWKSRAPWRFVTQAPAPSGGKTWMDPGFRDGSWKRSSKTFGAVKDKEVIRFAERWRSSSLYLRRHFNWKGGKVKRAEFMLYHACNVKIYLNGTLIINKDDQNDWWEKIDVPVETFAGALQDGDNVLAVEAHAELSARYFDCGLRIETEE